MALPANMGGGNSGFSRTKGKAAPNPYDLKPGEYRDFQNAFPFGTSKSGKAAVAVVGGVPTLAVLGLLRRRARSKAALSPDGSTRAPRLTGEDYVYNSRTSGPKKAIYGPPRKPSAPTRPFIEADAPIKSVTASKISDKTRNAVRQVAKDALTFPRQLLTLGQYNPVVPDYTSLPASSKGVPRNPTPTRARFARSQVLSANAKSEGMTSGQRGGLRRKANNAANAAKPMIQNALRKREQGYARQEFGQQQTEVANKYLKTKANIGEYAANSKVMRSAFATRFPGPGDTPAAKVPDAPKPTTPKNPKAPKAPKTPTPKAPAATTVEIKAPEMTARAFQPGKLEGETRAQTSARHVAEHAADNAAKRAEKKKVEPKNKTKAPTSAKPPSPAAVEKVSAPYDASIRGRTLAGRANLEHRGVATTPQEYIEVNKIRRADDVQKAFAIKMGNPYAPAGGIPEHDPSVKFKTSQSKRFPAAPSPAAVEKAPVRHPRSEPGLTFNPSEGSWSNDLQTRAYTLTNRADARAATADAATRAEKKIAKTSYNKYKHAASRTFKSSQRKRFPTVPPPDMPMSPSEPHSPAWGAQGFEPERVSAPKVKSQPSDRTFHRRGIMLADKADMKFFTGMAAPAKEKKAAKKAYNKYKHNASRTFTASQRKRFGTGPGGTPATPSKPAGPKAPSGGFVSNYKPQVRTFDPMVGQKQYGLKSKPYNDSPEAHQTLVKEGMKGRTGDDQRPKHSRNAAGKFVLDSGPYSVEGTKKATSPMFPGGTVSNPQSNQPHMTGKGAKVIGERGNFRVWQGPRRSETIVEHRTGRQVSLPYNPNKQGPVDVSRILTYANKGTNEKAFLKGGWTADGRSITGKTGLRSKVARFTIGAAKSAGILSLPIAAVSVLAGSDPLEAAGFQVDRAGEGSTWYAKDHPKKFAAHVKAANKARAVYQGRRAGSQFKGAASWADIARKYTAGKK